MLARKTVFGRCLGVEVETILVCAGFSVDEAITVLGCSITCSRH